MHATTTAAIAAIAARLPETPAIISTAGKMDFATLARTVDGTAAALMRRGVLPGSDVGQVIGDTPADLVVLLALFRLGAPVLTMSALETPAERRALLASLGARFCVAAAARQDDGAAEWVAYEELPAETDPGGLPPPPDPATVAHYNRSSGTTMGQAKLIGITHAQRAGRAWRETGHYARGPGDRHLHVLALAHSFARGIVIATLVRGGAVVFPPTFTSIDALRRFVREAGITVAAMTPPYVRDMLVKLPAAGPLLPGVRLLVGSAPLSRQERRVALERLTPDLYIHYATNETGPLAIASPDDLAVDIDSVGRALPEIIAEVVDDDLRPLPPAAVGELRFRHPEFPTAYKVAVPGSSSRFQGGWFYPGDAGAIDADGRITLRGRMDDVINVGGRKVHPATIEGWLSAHPAVAEAAALGVRSPRLGQVPVAAVVLRSPVPEKDLLQFCRTRGGSLPLPRRVVALEALPLNRGGKVDRTALAALLAPHLAPPR